MAGLAVVAIIWFTGDDSADVTAAESEPAVQADPDDPVDALDDGVGVEEADLAVQNIEAQPHLILTPELPAAADSDAADVLGRTERVARERAMLLGLASSDVAVKDETILIALGDVGEAKLTARLRQQIRLEFRPVCAGLRGGSSDDGPEPPMLPSGDCSAATESLIAELQASAFRPTPLTDQVPEAMAIVVNELNESSLLLGPATSVGDAVAEASAEEFVPGSWSVNLTFEAAGISLVNEQFAICFDAQPRCPLQQLAILANGELISAPSVQTPQVREGIVVSGTLDEVAARDLAADLTSVFPVEFELELSG